MIILPYIYTPLTPIPQMGGEENKETVEETVGVDGSG